jgi:Fe-Mn family superoxide dismutase
MKQFIPFILCIALSVVGVQAQHTLPQLPYAYKALEPHIDSTTMYIHLNNHHAAYVTNLNKALEKYPELQKLTIQQLLGSINTLPAEIKTTVRNSGGGHLNHAMFWKMLAPAGSTSISKAVEKMLTDNFGSVDAFKTKFESASIGRFGSGWVWLLKTADGKLIIESTANQDNTYMDVIELKGKPVLALDVWEHAYYLKYQSKRAAYVKAFWNVVNWNEVERLMNV